jgi:predicted transcriptional regulator
MINLQLEQPIVEAVEIDPETLAAIDRGVEAADEGQTVTLDEVRKMVPEWISKFESLPRP